MTDDPLALLRQIPELALEVEMTRDHPNPDGEQAFTSRPETGSRPPTDLAALHATMPDGDADYAGRGLRGTLGMCVRLVIEEMADSGPTAEVPDYPSDTWSGICGWLASAHPAWSVMPWADDIVHDIRQVHRDLSNLARVQAEPSYRCRRCGDPMRLQPGGAWLLCDSGHTETADLEKQWRRRPALPDYLAAAELGLTVERIRVWRSRGKIKPTKVEAGRPWYLPWDLLLLANPGVAEAVRRAEALAP